MTVWDQLATPIPTRSLQCPTAPLASPWSSLTQISDALIKMGVKHGGLIPDIKMYSPLYEAGETRIAGPAFTVEVRRSSSSSTPGSRPGLPALTFSAAPRLPPSACGSDAARFGHLPAQRTPLALADTRWSPPPTPTRASPTRTLWTRARPATLSSCRPRWVSGSSAEMAPGDGSHTTVTRASIV